MADEIQETKADLIAKAKELPPTEIFTLKPRNFEEAYRYANFLSGSNVIPKEFQGNPANVLVAIQLGMELGVSPMQAIQNIYVVNGKPSLYGDLLPAIVYSSGLLESIKEEGDATTASCTVKRKGFDSITRTFTWEDAKRAKAMEYGKVISLADKQTYQSYPKRMLQLRARAWAIRDAFPDVLKGVAIKEEIEDSIDVTPERETPKPLMEPKPLKKETVASQPFSKGESRVEDARQPVATEIKEEKVEAHPENGAPKEVGGPESDKQSDEQKTAASIGRQENPSGIQPSDQVDSPSPSRRTRKSKETPTQQETPPEVPEPRLEEVMIAWIAKCPDEEIWAQPGDKYEHGTPKNLVLNRFNDLVGDDVRMRVLSAYNAERMKRRKAEESAQANRT